jgi:hypothetical protein
MIPLIIMAGYSSKSSPNRRYHHCLFVSIGHILVLWIFFFFLFWNRLITKETTREAIRHAQAYSTVRTNDTRITSGSTLKGRRDHKDRERNEETVPIDDLRVEDRRHSALPNQK